MCTFQTDLVKLENSIATIQRVMEHADQKDERKILALEAERSTVNAKAEE